MSIPEASGIYKITCTVTGKFYIGSAINLRERQQGHFRTLRHNIHENPKLQNAWNKYGEQAFTFEVLELVLPMSLTAREQYWFDKLKPFGNKGFNIARVAGSSLGIEKSPETREKLRQANLGKPGYYLGKKLSPEHRENLRKSHLGQVSHWTGKKRPPETCEKIGISKRGNTYRRGKKMSPETREKLRQSHLGKTLSEEQKRKMSEAQRGKKMSPEAIEKRLSTLRVRGYDFTHTPETRARMSASKKGQKPAPQSYEGRKKTYILTSPDGTEYIVHGLKQFCREHNLNASNLIQVAKGRVIQAKGWTARYPET